MGDLLLAGTAVWHPLNRTRPATSASNANLLAVREMRQMNIVPKSGTIAKVIRPSPELCKEALDLAAVIVSCDEVAAPFTRCRALEEKAQESVGRRFWHESLTEPINELIEDK